jgi:glucose/mannose transport system permease protein
MAMLALLPGIAILGVFFCGFIVWTVVVSFTASRRLPRFEFVGFANYAELAGDARFRQSFAHLLGFGLPFVVLSLVIGLGLAIAIDRLDGRRAAMFRLIFLAPLAMSWLVTGLVWQWILNPGLGLEHVVQGLGLPGFRFDALVRPDTALMTLVAAACWHSAGLVMALLLAGLRGIDPQIWQVTRMERIPLPRVYLHVILPQLRPHLVSAALLLTFGVVRMFELVVAMTGGGPGFATDMPALFIQDHIFARGRLGFGAAAAVVLMATMIVVLAPYLALTPRRRT